MLKLNGESVEFTTDINVTDFLSANGFETRFIAVEINNEIVPKATYNNHIIHDGDVIEVVRLVGGG